MNDLLEHNTTRLAALRTDWDALRQQKAAAWEALQHAVDLVETAWQALLTVHARQQAVCADLDALPVAPVQDWVTRHKLSLFYGATRDPYNGRECPWQNDAGMTGTLRALAEAHKGRMTPPPPLRHERSAR